MQRAPVRKVRLGKVSATVKTQSDGSMLVCNTGLLTTPPARITDRLDHWAVVAPDRIWLAERDRQGGWRTLSYGEGLSRVRRIAAALATRPLSAERPIVILSGNSIGHALLGTAALYAGIPYAPIAPAYATISSDFTKLRAVIDLLTPGLIFVADAGPFERAIRAVVSPEVDLVVEAGHAAWRTAVTLDELEREVADVTATVDQRRDAIGPDTIAKFLFTSGSTGVPKGVINTHGMLTTNVAQIADHFAFFRDEPPVIVDWAPWNHTAGGNHNFNLIIDNGGTFYIDDGRPSPSGIGATLRTLREISPTWYFNVPKGFAALLPHLAADDRLRANFFRRLNMMWYAGAGMARYVWDDLDALSVQTTGERVIMLTGLGSTETAPFAMAADHTMVDAGLIGLPARGCELKLVPMGGKLEARVRGPNITPGYWRQPEQTAAAFDEDGFYRLGDALRFAVPGEVSKGFYFDGRIAEDFKLATGTWVAVGPLRTAFIDHCAPYIQDAVIAGLDRDFVAALVFVDVEHCRALAKRPDASLADLSCDATVRALFRDLLVTFAASATGSSTRIARLVLVDQAASIDSAELTDKGSVNQRAVLTNRSALVERVFAVAPEADMICV
jgi:feruloyl-CoA synthase